MTQNNERELLVKIKYAICMAIYSDDGLDGLEGENLMKEIDKYLSPISQTEHQELVTNLWEALGKWSAYLASNGEQAELSPPSWLIDAVKNATSPISQNEHQEAVAWRYVDSRGNYRYRSYVDDFDVKYKSLKPVKLYTSPPKQMPDGWKLVKIEPSDEHLRSMAIRSDHGLGIDGYYDTKPVQFGASHAQRMESTIREMRQLYEEAIGEGFYKLPEAPTTSLTSETNTEVGE